MKSKQVFLNVAVGSMVALAACAQAPAPAPPPPPAGDVAPAPPAVSQQLPGTSTTYNSRVRTVIYGPRGEEQALVLRNGVAVTLPPDLAMRIGPTISRGTRVQVSGLRQVFAGETSVAAQSVVVNGQTYIAGPPAPGAGPAGAVAAAAPPPPPPGARPRPGRRGPAGAREARPAPPPPPGDAAPPPPPADGATPPPPPPQN